MRKIIMIMIMAMVAFGTFAKSFHYESCDDEWTYFGEERRLYSTYKFSYGTEYDVTTYDVSEEEAWKIIKGEEFPTFEVLRSKCGKYVFIYQIPTRDYSNRVK